MKTRTLLYPVLAALFVLAACNPQDPENPGDNPGGNPEEQIKGFQLSVYELAFAGTADQKTVDITTAKTWKAVSNADWCTVSPASGTGSATVTVKAAANSSKEEARSARVSFQYDDLTVTLNVSQELSPEEPIFSITPSAVSVSGGGETFDITVVSDARAYEVTVVDSWLSLSSRSGDRHTGETLTFKAASNEEGSVRTGVISVCTENGSCIPVIITQEAGNPLYVHRHLAMRFTATWCGYCPYMDEAFHKIDEQRDDFEYMTIHASSGYPLYYSESGTLAAAYNVTGYPTGVINGWKELGNYTNSDYTASMGIDMMNQYDETFKCVAGIALSSSSDGVNINVKATVETGVTDKFYVSAFVLESGIIQTQTYYPSSGGSINLTDFEHDNVVRACLNNNVVGDRYTSTALVPTEYSWSTKLRSEWKAENLYVLVIVQRKYASDAQKGTRNYPDGYVVNALRLPVGESADIEYASAK